MTGSKKRLTVALVQPAPVYGVETAVCGEVGAARIEEGRMVLHTDGHYSRPQVVTLEIDTRKRPGLSRRVDK